MHSVKSKNVLTNNTQGSRITLECDEQQYDTMLQMKKLQEINSVFPVKISNFFMAKNISTT